MADAANLARGLPPVGASDARILILGSMPGRLSLEKQQYYAHPRNAFWRIMGELLGFAPELPYATRRQRLIAGGVALWDVIAVCERPGSLDADIAPASVQVNDFPAFFAAHPAIRRVYFNGAAAETAFRRHVAPLPGLPRLAWQRLPSTSPAHAARAYADKLAAWAALLAPEKAAVTAYNRPL